MPWWEQQLILEGMERDAAEQELLAAWQEENQRLQSAKIPKKPLPPPLRPPWGAKPGDPIDIRSGVHAAKSKRKAQRRVVVQDVDDDEADLLAPAPAQGTLFGDPHGVGYKVREVAYSGHIPSEDEVRAAIKRDAKKAIEAAQGRYGGPVGSSTPAPEPTASVPAATPARPAPQPAPAPVPMPKPPPAHIERGGLG